MKNFGVSDYERPIKCLFRYVSVNCYYLVSVSENIIVGPHGVPDPPSLAQMTFTQCTSMSELKFDSGAPPGGQIQQYVSALFESPTKDMA